MSHATVSRDRVNGKPVTVAKFKAVCYLCDQPIQVGDPIVPVKQMPKRTRWAHKACAQADGAPAGAAAPTPPEDGVIKAVGQALGAVQDRLARLESAESSQPRTIELKTPQGDTRKVEGATHPVFDEVVELAHARDNVFLPGPSGSGKSHLAGQVAEALGLRFGFISCSAGMSESQLLGRMVPTGEHGQFEFQTTEFLRCYEEGGVFLFDELDAADANVLLVVNAALANGHLAVPSRTEKPVAERHPDFVCLAAANTWGRGADRQYCGRNELDESTMDRFRMGTVPMDYDEGLEAQLCPDPALRRRLQTYRQRIRNNRLERIVSTRFIAQAYVKKHQYGWSDERIDAKLFQGWRADEVRRVTEGGAR
jgi:cobaltochelatase CobS